MGNTIGRETNLPTTPTELRKFGLLIGGVFLVISLWPMVVRGEDVHGWALVVAALFTIPACLLPTCLGPVYRAWMRIGGMLGWVNTRIILGLGFFGVFTPLGLARRCLGKDSLHRKLDLQATSYRVSKIPRPRQDLYKQY